MLNIKKKKSIVGVLFNFAGMQFLGSGKRRGFHVSRKFGVLNKLKWWEENWSEAKIASVEACLVL